MGNSLKKSFVSYVVEPSLEHLNEKNVTYINHMFNSLYFTKELSVASIKSFIHSFLPCYFTTSTTDTIARLDKKLK